MTILISLITLTLLAPERIDVSTTKRFIEYYKYDKLYESVLNSIKKFEGVRLTSYYCPAGYKTIGVGHLIRDYEVIDDTITLEQADSLLKIDFEESVETITKLLNYDRYKEPEKTLALAHFVFNIGGVAFEKSNLLHLIKENKPIRYEFLRWVHYRDLNNKVIVSNNLINMRSYESTLFSYSGY